MELTAKIIAVERAFEGVIVVIQQNKMKIPIAEELDTDESIVAKKFARSLKGMGLNIDMRQVQEAGFRTGFWMTMEEYEELGKPSIDDVIKLSVKAEKSDVSGTLH